MARTQCEQEITLETGEDLDGELYAAVTIDSTGRVVMTDAATEPIVGFVSMDPGPGVGVAVRIMTVQGGGIVNARASAAITRGHIIIPTTTDGEVAGVANLGALAVDQQGAGIALDAATGANQIIRVLAQVMAAPHVA